VRKNKKLLGITIIMALVFVVSSVALADDNTISDLLPWEGSNETYINLFATESADDLFAEIAKYADGYNGEMVYEYLAEEMYKTSFSKLEIVDAKTVVIDDKIEAKYDYIGNLNTVWGEYSIAWYIFRTNNAKAINAGFKQLILMPYHGHGDGMKHCHMRYGNEDFDFLTTDPSLENWWPTLFRTGQVNKEKAVQGMMNQAKMMSSMLPPLK
jgi:hypothetical protein